MFKRNEKSLEVNFGSSRIFEFTEYRTKLVMSVHRCRANFSSVKELACSDVNATATNLSASCLLAQNGTQSSFVDPVVEFWE